MGYSIHTIYKEYFTVVYSGEVDLDERMQALNEVCEIVQKQGYSSGLIDVRQLQMNMSLDEQFEYAKLLTSKKELRNLKVAILHEQNKQNPNLVIDTVAFNSGHRTVPFYHEDEAKLWLLGHL